MDNQEKRPATGAGKWRLPFRITPVTLALCTYVLLMLARFIDAAVLTRDNEYLAVILLQMAIFLIPAVGYVMWRGEAFRPKLRLRMIRPDQLLLILGAGLCLCGGGMLLQLLTGAARTGGESFALYDTFISKPGGSVGNTLYLVLAYAALPAFCEELIFRGIVCAEYERHGVPCASLMSMLLFTVLHFDLQHAPTYLFAGLVLCATLYATRSLLAVMLVHFGYNLFCLFGVPYVSAVYASMGQVWVLIFLLIVAFLFGALVFCGEAARLYRHHATHGSHEGAGESVNTAISRRDSTVRFLRRLLTPQVALCVLLYIVVIVVEAVR